MNVWPEKPETINIEQDKIAARVIGKQVSEYTIGNASGEFQASVSGKFIHNAAGKADFPAVGDWVICRENGGKYIIEEILPRKSALSRKSAGLKTEEQVLAANVDIVCVVMGLDGGRNFSARGLERYLTIVWDSGAVPLVILNKCDIGEDIEDKIAEAEASCPGAEIIAASARTGEGLNKLKAALSEGKTAVFVGPSGVGKSALSNAILHGEFQKTGSQRESDLRGRHTTTSSRMFRTEQDAFIIDSPGLKELQLWADRDGVDSAFEEIAALAEHCRFRDCSHQNEPGCAVQAALADGSLDMVRFNNYLDLARETAYLERRKNEKERHYAKNKGKELARYIKQMKSGKEIY